MAVSTRVLLADDQQMVRAGFRMILESEPDIEVVGEAENGEQATAATRRLRPDVVLMDIQIRASTGWRRRGASPAAPSSPVAW